jgi:hydroxymethylpyrimidine pyrophosphatase-like HAD family hydrolase
VSGGLVVATPKQHFGVENILENITYLIKIVTFNSSYLSYPSNTCITSSLVDIDTSINITTFLHFERSHGRNENICSSEYHKYSTNTSDKRMLSIMINISRGWGTQPRRNTIMIMMMTNTMMDNFISFKVRFLFGLLNVKLFV